jgi:hypothetical protein
VIRGFPGLGIVDTTHLNGDDTSVSGDWLDALSMRSGMGSRMRGNDEVVGFRKRHEEESGNI